MKQDSSQFNSADPPSEKAIFAAEEAIRKARLPIGPAGLRVTCAELRELVDMRMDDALCLVWAKRACAAYYLAGYAVELALKVRIAETVRQCEFPSTTLANAACRHNLVQLVSTAGLSEELKRDCNAKPQLRSRWETVFLWSESSRYESGIPLSKAFGLIEAISAPTDGALVWIKQHWGTPA
jgi:hypothetical protein